MEVFSRIRKSSDLAFLRERKCLLFSTKRNTEEQLNFLWEVYDGNEIVLD